MKKSCSAAVSCAPSKGTKPLALYEEAAHAYPFSMRYSRIGGVSTTRSGSKPRKPCAHSTSRPFQLSGISMA